MIQTLIISGHPKLSRSAANRGILVALIELPNVTVTDVRTNYPNGQIDVPMEQQRLSAASLIILQFPFVWYGMPAHMRHWMETVFASGFAYGEGGGALRNKHLLLSVTLGGSNDAYSISGQHRYPVESFLRPLEMFARYCGMNYLPPVYSYAMVENSNGNENTLSEKITRHVQRVSHIIHSFNENPYASNKALGIP